MRGIASFALFLYIGLSATGSVDGVAESTGSQGGAVSEALEKGRHRLAVPRGVRES
jgi:hypothetical protein